MTKQESKQSNSRKHAQSRAKAKQVKDRITARQRRIVSAMYQPLCKILILIGIATILLAIVIVWQYRSSTRRTATTTGTITEVDKVSGIGRDMDGDDAQKCRIGYTVEIDGRIYTDVLGYRGDPTVDKCDLTVGQTIDISYDPSHPANNSYLVDDESSDHGTFNEAVASATGIALVGLIPLIIGMMGLHLARRYRDDQIEVIVSEESLHSTSYTKSQTKPAKTRKKDK